MDKLSVEGWKLIHDARNIIETARLMVWEKNADGLFQNFIWHTRDVGAAKDPDDMLPIEKNKAREDDQPGGHCFLPSNSMFFFRSFVVSL